MTMSVSSGAMLLGLGAFHGINPGMGWLFAVALGMQERRRTAVYRVAAWSREIRPSDLLNEQRKRIVSVTWSVPDDVLADVADKMTAWVIERYGDLDVTLRTQEEFLLSITRLPA